MMKPFQITGFPMVFDVVDRFAKDLNIDKLQIILTILSRKNRPRGDDRQKPLATYLL